MNSIGIIHYSLAIASPNVPATIANANANVSSYVDELMKTKLSAVIAHSNSVEDIILLNIKSVIVLYLKIKDISSLITCLGAVLY